ncbi:MAG: DUF3592 domain-containing protein [Phycisphaerae bacterium]|nr:DUF3592 domain-containing protein [Phycisphaerae bacterium]
METDDSTERPADCESSDPHKRGRLTFYVIGCAILVVADVVGLSGLVRDQLQVLSYASATGTLTRTEAAGVLGTSYNYKYEVSGRAYTASAYSFDDFAVPEGSDVWRELRAGAGGRTVTVYYDTADPSKSVLTRILYSRNWHYVFQLLFAGMLLLLLAPELVRLYRTDRFRNADAVLNSGWIPGWGKCRARNDTWTINSTSQAVRIGAGLCLCGYIAAWGIFLFNAGDASLAYVNSVNVLLVAVGILAVGVIAAVVLRVVYRPSVLTIDVANRRMRLETRRRNLDIGLDEIRCWTLQNILHPDGLVSSSPVLIPLLSVRTDGGASVPVRLFTRASKHEVLEQIALELAGLTGANVDQLPDEKIEFPIPGDSAKARVQYEYAKSARTAKNRQQFADVR